MDNVKSVAVIGAGALGSMYMESLIKNKNIDSYFLCDNERFIKLNSKKIYVNGNILKFKVKTFNNNFEAPDLLIIAVKNYNLKSLKNILTNCCGDNTIIISVLNGISSESKIKSFLPNNIILNSVVLGMDAVMDNRNSTCSNLTYSNRGKVVLGAIDSTEEQYVNKVIDLLKSCSLDYEISQDILRDIWYKWMINIGVNQVSAVTGASYGLFQDDKTTQQLMEETMLETIKIGKLEGININESDIAKWYSVLNQLGRNGKTSMLQDIEANRKTEVDYFSGELIKLADKHNVEVPINKTLFRIIKTKELTYS